MRLWNQFEALAAHRAAGWALLAFALGLRLIGLGKGLWLDEAYTLDRAIGGSFADLARRLEVLDHPPLFFVLLHLLARLEDSWAVLRLVPAGIGVALVAVVHRWTRRYGHLEALVAGLLAASLPILLRNSSELRSYSLLAFAAAIAFATAERIRDGGSGRASYAVLGAALGLAAFTHHVGALVALPAAMLLLGTPAGRPRPRLAPLAAAFAVPVAVAVASGIFDDLGGKDPGTWWMPRPDGALVLTSLHSWLMPASQSWLPTAERSPIDLGLAAATAALAVFAGLLGRRRDVGRLLVAAALYVGALLAISWLVLPVFWNRTTVPAVVLLVVATAAGAGAARTARIRLALALALAAAAFGFATRWLGAEARRPLEPWADVAARMLLHEQPDDLVLVHPGYATSALRRHLDGHGPERLVRIPPRGIEPARRARLAVERSARRGWSTIWIVLRLDTPSEADAATRKALFESVALGRGGHPVRALVVSALESAMRPGLPELRGQVEAELTAALGRPTLRVDEGQFVEYQFVSGRTAAASESPGP